MKDPYIVLEVEKTATLEEIKKAYRRKARETHPDVNDGDDEVFKEINEAYQILSNPELRKMYDERGFVSNTPNLYDVANSKLQDMFMFVISSHGFRTDQVDVLSIIKDNLFQQTEQAKRELQRLTQLKSTVTSINDRIVYTGNSVNVLNRRLQFELMNMERALTAAQSTMELNDKVLEILSDYEFTFEKTAEHVKNQQIIDVFFNSFGR